MTVRYLDLADFVSIASEVAGLDVVVVLKVANLDLADSALHAPAAGFGDTDFYTDFVDKAAVLLVRLAATIRCQTGTSAPRGWRRASSSKATGGLGA